MFEGGLRCLGVGVQRCMGLEIQWFGVLGSRLQARALRWVWVAAPFTKGDWGAASYHPEPRAGGRGNEPFPTPACSPPDLQPLEG